MAHGDHEEEEEEFDILTKTGLKTGFSKPRSAVHRDGDYHQAVHVWIFAESTQQLLLQKRADCKDSWPGLWDISSAGHVSAGDTSLITARRELEEELGVILPNDAFELLFVFLQECVTNDGKFIDNEFDDVYLVTTLDPIPLEAFTLQESEVSAVTYISVEEYKHLLANVDPRYAPYNVDGPYGQLFDIITKRYQKNTEAQSLLLQQQLARYAPISLTAELTGLSEEDKEVLALLIQAAKIMDDIFYKQVWYSNSTLRDWLNEHGEISELDMLKWKYYLINKSPWSCLDENEAFLTTADSAVRLLPEATKQVAGWKGLSEKEKQDATGFFNVIRRHNDTHSSSTSDLGIVPYSQEYSPYLTKAAELLHKAGDLTSSPSLKRLLHSKADAFLSNDYYDSDIAWMELDSKLDVTIGPYETYEDVLFGYKATFEAFIGVRDDKATTQLKLFGDQLQVLEQNLPMDDMYKSKDVISAPIRVIQLVYNSGDVKGPQTVAFNLPNDERIVKDRGSSMVMLKNVSEAKFKLILQLIADKGQALQFNWLFEKGAIVLLPDQTFSVDFDKIADAAESLSREILTIQAKGDKDAAQKLLEKYGQMTQPLTIALEKLTKVQVPVDIAPDFPIVSNLLPKK
uniref:NUDIX hydrolase 3 n=1 Tax=Tanacetum cinerariifolium TaxID=118510 RepID=A0A6L2JG61_TANCI|nr:NUDIX hydrolase 3 [Tanacetum cinerariifolium]